MFDTEIIGGFYVHVEEGLDKLWPDWRKSITRDIERVVDALPGTALDLLSNTRIYIHNKYLYNGETETRGAVV